ncbi:NADPH:quinone oxidoreductase family protein [Novosphingobium mathurense]|uniref:NADPH2:quinone reductase n=1 Tax=Novosphingobium mathurense TaxID=428990 RepID=A0A1U6HV04_9SPHN|nr:NADPH:quinone oxidoreductase family protein [Novosphingobium mathurense]SLJ99640.1 NADPH2:quinone reductase [Novosphingobium mathurense]
MKALLSRQPGGPEALELCDCPAPRPGRGEVLLRTQACGINFPDALIVGDKYQVRPPRPFAPGSEITGIVAAVGEGVEGWQVGDVAIALPGHGGLAEEVAVSAAQCFVVPKEADPVEGAALLVTFGTALYALRERGALCENETLLVLGAAGGVGLAAIGIGKLMGARVVASVSGDDKAEIARAAGADAIVIHSDDISGKEETAHFTRLLKDAVGPEGAQVVLDPVGGSYCEPALRTMGWLGRYLVLGFAASIPAPPLNLVLLKSCDIRGVFCGAFAEREPEKYRKIAMQVIEWWQAGHIRPRIDRTYPLERGGEALRRLANREAMGKVVVTMA